MVKYATLRPEDEEDHDIAHKYPFAAMEILCSSKQIAQALIEGGFLSKKDDDSNDDDGMDSENKMVRDILAARNNVSA